MKPFPLAGRNGWHGEVRLADGRTSRKSFPTGNEAQQWMTREQAKAQASQAPGRFIERYSGLNSASEVSKIHSAPRLAGRARGTPVPAAKHFQMGILTGPAIG